MSMSASYTPYVGGGGLTEAARLTSVEVHESSASSTEDIGSRRPVAFRLHITKGMAARKGRITLRGVYKCP